MPIFVNFVQYGTAAALLALALLTGWDVIESAAPLFEVWFPILCIAALVGLVRRVRWGPVLVALVSIRVVLFIVARLIPDFDDVAGGTVLEHWLGYMPPAWLSWLIVVFGAALDLLPIVMLGKCKAWFRPVWW